MNITNTDKYIRHIENFFLGFTPLPLTDYELGMSIAKGNIPFRKSGFGVFSVLYKLVLLQAWDGLVYPL